jgi:hypothetical protein
MTQSQTRKLAAQLEKNPAGFSDTILICEDGGWCIVSTLREHSAVDANFLTEYRRCALSRLKAAHG